MARIFYLVALLLALSAGAAQPGAEVVDPEPGVTAVPDAFAPLAFYKGKAAADWLGALKARGDAGQLKAALEAVAELCPLGDGGPAAADELLAILKASNDVETSRLALFALGKMGSDAQACEMHLVGVLANLREAPAVRAAACRALIQIAPASTSVRNVILAATAAPSAELRREAFEALIILCMPATAADAAAVPVMPIPSVARKAPVVPGRSKPVVQVFTPGAFPYLPAFEALAKAALTARDATDADAALRTLGEAGVEPLVRALECASPLARAIAAEALGAMRRSGQRALPALLAAARKETDRRAREAQVGAAAALSPRDPAVLEFLAESVGARPDPLAPSGSRFAEELLLDAGREALPALRKAMRSENAAKRLALLNIITQQALQVPRDTRAAQTDFNASRLLPAAPLGIEDCLNDLTNRLHDREEAVRQLAVHTLNRMGPQAANAMGALTQAAAEASNLKTAAPKSTAVDFERDCVIAAMNVSRAVGTPAFLTLLDTRSAEYLLALLNSAASSERADAALALRLHAGDALVADVLFKLLEDPEPKVRRAAARALGACGARATPALTLLTSWLEAEPKSRWAAIETFADLGPLAAAAAPNLVKTAAEDAWPGDPEFATTLVRALRPHAETVVPALSGYVRSGSPQVRARSAQALALLGPSAAEAVPELLELAQSTDDTEAFAAFEALRAIGPEKDPGAIPYLSSVIRDSLFATRRKWAVRALGLSRPGLDADVPERSGALCDALLDGDNSVCEAARDALIQIGEPAIPRLLELATREKSGRNFWPLVVLAALKVEPDAVVPRLYAHTLPGAPVAKRVAAIECLGRYAKMRPDAAAALLRAMRSRDGDAARAALRALLPIAGDVRQPLERVLFDRDPALRKNAAFVLENF